MSKFIKSKDRTRVEFLEAALAKAGVEVPATGDVDFLSNDIDVRVEDAIHAAQLAVAGQANADTDVEAAEEQMHEYLTAAGVTLADGEDYTQKLTELQAASAELAELHGQIEAAGIEVTGEAVDFSQALAATVSKKAAEVLARSGNEDALADDASDKVDVAGKNAAGRKFDHLTGHDRLAAVRDAAGQN